MNKFYQEKLLITITVFISVILLFGCRQKETVISANKESVIKIDDSLFSKAKEYAKNQLETNLSNSKIERDNIFMLLAYAVVYADWQNSDNKHNRGYNIGSVLVNKENAVVSWARNSVNVKKNMTQHGEVRLIENFLKEVAQKDLKGYTIYTTLEPCAMCSGMMFLTNIERTIYGQKDPAYGNAIERLELNSTSLPNGYPPYPRKVKSEGSTLLNRHLLDYYYDVYMSERKESHITQFLTTPEAKYIFSTAINDLVNYTIKFEENKRIKKQALEFYEKQVLGS
ncbi:MAG: nucleoside deaminase [Bacteroidales bacterium]